MANLSSICLENTMDREAWQATVHGITGVGHNLATKPPQCFIYFLSWFLAIPHYIIILVVSLLNNISLSLKSI